MSAKHILLILSACAACVHGVGPQSGWSRPDAPLDVLYDKLFKDLKPIAACVGMNTRDGPSQCYVDKGTGPLYLVNSNDDWNVSLRAEGGMWNVVVGNEMPTDHIMSFLGEAVGWTTTTINSVYMRPLLRSELPESVGWSPQPVRPGNYSDLYKGEQPAWNPHGGGLWEKKLPIMMLLSDSDHTEAVARAQKNKDNGYSTYPKESMQLNYVMKSNDMNSSQCLKDGKCDVVGKVSYWSTTISTDKITNDTKFIGIALPITGTSLWTENSAPAQGAIMGSIVSALTLADAISSSRDLMKKELLFMFFDAELYGASGSFRFFKDITDWECLKLPEDPKRFCLNPNYALSNFTKINHENIEYLLGLDQLGIVERGDTYDPSSPDLYMYYDGAMHDRDPQMIDTMLNAFTTSGAKISGDGVRRYLPPSPVQSYLRIDDANRARTDLAVGVLAGYDGAFKNKYYGSVYDTADLSINKTRLNVTLLRQSATTLTEAIWKLAEGMGPAPSINETLVEALTECLGSNVNCPLVLGYLDDCFAIPQRNSIRSVSNMYPGLHKDRSINAISRFIFNFMGDKMALGPDQSSMEPCELKLTCNNTACSNPYEICVSNFEGGSGTCKLCPIFAHDAATPALFVNNQSHWDFDPRFSYLQVWTESVWQNDMGSRLFTADSNLHEGIMLLVGGLVGIASVVVVFIFRSMVVPKLKTE